LPTSTVTRSIELEENFGTLEPTGSKNINIFVKDT
jgi:hypothetical protein